MKIPCITATAAACLLMAQVACADERFTAPVTAEILPGWVQADGHRMAALRLSLAPGWKTYWRAPGDAGIPPTFDWSGSRNLAAVSLVWPAPRVFDQNGMRSVGYENEVVIPLRIETERTGEPVRLRLAMDLGICSDVCLPQELHLDATIDGSAATPTPAIVAALAQAPYSAKEAGVRMASCAVSPTSDGLRIETRVEMASAGAPEHVVIEPGLDDIWVSEAQTTREGGTVVAVSDMIHVSGGTIALDRSAVRITVLGSSHAVDIVGCQPG